MSKIQAKECQNMEYKRSWKDEYLKWICGFANAQGATMFFGVDDDLEVYGLKDAKRLLEDIPNKITTTMLCNSLIHKDYTGTFIQMSL